VSSAHNVNNAQSENKLKLGVAWAPQFANIHFNGDGEPQSRRVTPTLGGSVKKATG